MEVEHPHIYLYAKYWYEKDDLIKDLRKLISYECAIEEKFIQDIDVVKVMIHLAVTTIEKYIPNKFLEVEKLLFDTLTERVYYNSNIENPSEYERIIISCLSTIRHSIVPDLPKPDYTLLPKSNLQY